MTADERTGPDRIGEGDAGAAEGRRTPVPSPPGEARFPGWLLPILGALAAGAFAGWAGAVFGAVVGFLVWRARG